MSHDPEQPAVGAILEQLRAEIRSQRLARGVAEQGGYERDVRRALDEVELHRVVSAHWPLVARSPFERATNLVHKVVRRYLRWYINPIVAQQNAYNDALARALRLLNDAYLDLAEQVAEATAHDFAKARATVQGQGSPVKHLAASEPASAANELDSRGRELDSRTRDLDSSGRELDSRGRDLDSPGHELDSPGRDLDSRGRELDSRTRDLDSPGRVLDSPRIGIESIMALVRKRAVQEPPARFPDLELRTEVAALRARPAVHAHWALGGATLWQRAVALHNRLVRQYLRWYINPIVEQQNAANSALLDAIAATARLDEQRRAQVAMLRAASASEQLSIRRSANDSRD